MQHVLSALFLPAVPVSFSGILMAVAAILAGGMLLTMTVKSGLQLVMVSARKRSRTTSEYNEDKAA